MAGSGDAASGASAEPWADGCVMRQPGCSVDDVGEYLLPYAPAGWLDVYRPAVTTGGYYAHGQDNSLPSALAAFGVSGQLFVSALLLGFCCGRCCARSVTPGACRTFIVAAHACGVLAYLCAGLFHLRLAFGNLKTPLDLEAYVEIDGLRVSNTCFADADLFHLQQLALALVRCRLVHLQCLTLVAEQLLGARRAPFKRAVLSS